MELRSKEPKATSQSVEEWRVAARVHEDLNRRVLTAESELQTREGMLAQFANALVPSEHQHGAHLSGGIENQRDIEHEI